MPCAWIETLVAHNISFDGNCQEDLVGLQTKPKFIEYRKAAAQEMIGCADEKHIFCPGLKRYTKMLMPFSPSWILNLSVV